MARRKSFKVTFTLDESDAAHFRKLFREARKSASEEDPEKVLKDVKSLIERVRSSKRKVPRFVEDAISTLEDLIEMMEDEDYALPKSERTRVLAALAYFANPEDLIPDHIPALGFLDDAIMVKFVEDEFRHELWAYRKFRKFREGAEQRPWTSVARKRLPKRLADYRKELRAKVRAKKAEVGPRPTGW